MDKLGNKDFTGWIKIKEKIHNDKPFRTISESEVWWCKIGENVGSEICGKGDNFLRPALIVCKLSKINFIGVPLTSKEHHGKWYVEFEFKGRKEFAVVAQVENMSTYRLHRKMGRVPWSDLNKVLTGLRELFEPRNEIPVASATGMGEYSRKCTSYGTRPSLKVNSIIARIRRICNRLRRRKFKKN